MESDDLEAEAKTEKPVKYHEAWQHLCGADGIIVPGGFGTRGTEGKIMACNWARKHRKPFLGKIGPGQAILVKYQALPVPITTSSPTSVSHI